MKKLSFIFAVLVMMLFASFSEAAGPRRIKARVGRRANVVFNGRNRAFLFNQAVVNQQLIGNQQAFLFPGQQAFLFPGQQAFTFNGRRHNQAFIFAGGTSYGNQQLIANQQFSYGNQQFSYGNQQLIANPYGNQQIVIQRTQAPCPTTQQETDPCPTTQQFQIQQPAVAQAPVVVQPTNMYGTCGSTQQFRFRGYH